MKIAEFILCKRDVSQRGMSFFVVMRRGEKMQIQKRRIDEIRPASYNPRIALKEGDKNYEKLKRSIEEFGYVEPIIINEQTGNVVGGHQRLTVLKDLGVEEIDCVIVNVDEKKEKQLNIALNKINGEWDMPALKDLLEDLDTGDIDMDLTGFEDWEIENLMTQSHIDIDDFFEEKEEKKEESSLKEDKEIQCPHCKMWFKQ